MTEPYTREELEKLAAILDKAVPTGHDGQRLLAKARAGLADRERLDWLLKHCVIECGYRTFQNREQIDASRGVHPAGTETTRCSMGADCNYPECGATCGASVAGTSPATPDGAELLALAEHHIPFYAYGDNQAACEMADRLEKIAALFRERSERPQALPSGVHTPAPTVEGA